MSWYLLSTLLRKDLTLYFKNRFFALITALGIVAYAAIYFLMPATIDETFELGVVASNLPQVFLDRLAEEGVILVPAESDAVLKQAILDGDLAVGVVLPEDLMTSLALGQRPTAQMYFSNVMPEELRDGYPILIQELIASLAGESLQIEVNEEIFGRDMAGQQISTRNRMLPLLAVLILMMETLGLASLISTEIAWGTLPALLVTPVRVETLFAAKGVMGVSLAFSEVAFFLGVTGGLKHEPLLILLALLFGALLVTGVAFLLASVSKDMMSVIGWGILALLLLAIPSINVLIPSLTTAWARAIPSYYLVEAVYQVANYDAGWGDVGRYLLILLVYALAFFAAGVLVLRRRFR